MLERIRSPVRTWLHVLAEVGCDRVESHRDVVGEDTFGSLRMSVSYREHAGARAFSTSQLNRPRWTPL